MLNLLRHHGVSDDDATTIAGCWLIQGDFLLVELPDGYDVVIGNPPYVRQERIDDVLMATYRSRYSTLYDRADLYVPFIERSLGLLRPGGRLVVVGIPSNDRMCLTASVVRRKGLTISLARRMKAEDLARAVRLAAAGRVELASLVTERHSLDDFEDAFAGLSSRRGLKVVVQP